jgi:hypothetical protein
MRDVSAWSNWFGTWLSTALTNLVTVYRFRPW